MSLRLLQFMPGAIWNHIRGDEMKGTIKYLQTIRDICRNNNGDCKRCPLGEKRELSDNMCPRLTHPNTWSNERIVKMVRSVDNVQ
jgi:hypothetical protein